MFRTCVFEQKTTQKLDIRVPLTNFATVGAVAWKWSPWVIPQKNFILVGRACSWPEQGKPKTVTPIVPPLVPKPYAICKALHDVHRSMPFMFGHVFKIDFPPCLKTPQYRSPSTPTSRSPGTHRSHRHPHCCWQLGHRRLHPGCSRGRSPWLLDHSIIRIPSEYVGALSPRSNRPLEYVIAGRQWQLGHWKLHPGCSRGRLPCDYWITPLSGSHPNMSEH